MAGRPATPLTGAEQRGMINAQGADSQALTRQRAKGVGDRMHAVAAALLSRDHETARRPAAAQQQDGQAPRRADATGHRRGAPPHR